MTLLSSKETAKALGMCLYNFRKVLSGKRQADSESGKIIRELIDSRMWKSKSGHSYVYDAAKVEDIAKRLKALNNPICPQCKNSFVKQYHNAIYCSPECKRLAKNERYALSKPKKPSQASQNPSQALAATKTPSKSSQKPQKAYSENKSNFFKSIQPTNEYGMPSDYQTGQQTVNTQHLCECGRSANPFTGKCSTCAIQSRYRQMQPIRMKGI